MARRMDGSNGNIRRKREGEDDDDQAEAQTVKGNKKSVEKIHMYYGICM